MEEQTTSEDWCSQVVDAYDDQPPELTPNVGVSAVDDVISEARAFFAESLAKAVES